MRVCVCVCACAYSGISGDRQRPQTRRGERQYSSPTPRWSRANQLDYPSTHPCTRRRRRRIASGVWRLKHNLPLRVACLCEFERECARARCERGCVSWIEAVQLGRGHRRRRRSSSVTGETNTTRCHVLPVCACLSERGCARVVREGV